MENETMSKNSTLKNVKASRMQNLRANKFPTHKDHQQTSGRRAFHAGKDVSLSAEVNST